MLNACPTAHQWSTNQQQSILSECTSLIEKEFPDDSEDEEYHPDKMFEEEEDEYDDDEFKIREVNKSIDTEHDLDISDNTTAVDVNVKVQNNKYACCMNQSNSIQNLFDLFRKQLECVQGLSFL